MSHTCHTSLSAGNRKLGVTRVLYDTSYSERGVLVAAARVPRKANPFDYQPPLLIKEYDPDRKKRRRDQQVGGVPWPASHGPCRGEAPTSSPLVF